MVSSSLGPAECPARSGVPTDHRSLTGARTWPSWTQPYWGSSAWSGQRYHICSRSVIIACISELCLQRLESPWRKLNKNHPVECFWDCLFRCSEHKYDTYTRVEKPCGTNVFYTFPNDTSKIHIQINCDERYDISI